VFHLCPSVAHFHPFPRAGNWLPRGEILGRRDANVATCAGKVAALVHQPMPPVHQLVTVSIQPAPPVGKLVTIVHQLAPLAAKSRRWLIVSPQGSVNPPRGLVVPLRLRTVSRRGFIVSWRWPAVCAATLPSRHDFFASCPIFCGGKKPDSATIWHSHFSQGIARRKVDSKCALYQN